MNDKLVEKLRVKLNNGVEEQIKSCGEKLALQYKEQNPEVCEGLSIEEIMLMYPLSDVEKGHIIFGCVKDYIEDLPASFFLDIARQYMNDLNIFLRLMIHGIELSIIELKKEVELNEKLLGDRSYQALRKTELRQDINALNRTAYKLNERMKEINAFLDEEEERGSERVI